MTTVSRTIRPEADEETRLRWAVADAIEVATAEVGRTPSRWVADVGLLVESVDLLARCGGATLAGTIAIARESVSQALVAVAPVHAAAGEHLRATLAGDPVLRRAHAALPAPDPDVPVDPWLRGSLVDHIAEVLEAAPAQAR